MVSSQQALRLFVLHHAGGSHVTYRHWPAALPGHWDVTLLDAPGHGRRIGSQPLDDAGRLADFLLGEIEPELPVPYALFGHSMGALVAYEIARRATDRGLPVPVWLGVSARPAPVASPAQGRSPGWHALPDAALRTRLQGLGGTPAGILDDPSLWALYAPVIRADLRVVESWRPTPGAGPLPTALSAYAGREDFAVSPLMSGWESHAEHFLGLRSFNGGHFYFLDDPEPLLRSVERDAETALRILRERSTAVQ
ncbi:thioesterase [Streptomyces sp. YC504]|uniref:Thioesterase n=1 Tax=Streptomyces mesophilus TaxID=1775132 RepID=A0A6G4XCA0_9ACTN|nr:thioesterase [Streptomyces mesophilus]